jgi:DNA topoisomerase I
MSANTSGNRLVIVESPAKAKTIQNYLGPGYIVKASYGHIRDLPATGQIPAEIKGKSWSRIAVDVENGFQTYYVVSPKDAARVRELKEALKGAEELLLATDEDREGEAISWHLMEVLRPKVPVKRMVFNEITKDAIRHAVENTRDLDMDLVDAQETRRVVDRLVGFELSPVLWRKIGTAARSAGRVQSVATRLVVDRERERIAFRSADYWDIEGLFDPGAFSARLRTVDGKRVASGGDFNDRGELKSDQIVALDEAAARALADSITGVPFQVSNVTEKPYRRSPLAPFTTSTLQQEASKRFRWGAQRTMRTAQSLYENGFITYMRTDSNALSANAVKAARSQAADLYGADHVSETVRQYTSKVKNAQEAHEAIRPAGDVFKTPGEAQGQLAVDEFLLYDLIWKRTIASQMADARGFTTTLTLAATGRDTRVVEFSASGTVITFKGWRAAFEETLEETEKADEDDERLLPKLTIGDVVEVRTLDPQGHSTQPIARYTEASLVKKLEELGIGRPSTYASTISTIVDRGYVVKRGSALVPAWLAFAVVRLLENHFGELVDYAFTARMEEELDIISNGDRSRLDALNRFYFGPSDSIPNDLNDFPGLSPLLGKVGEIDARDNATFPIADSDIVLRVGKYGPYIERGEQRANVPADLPPDELTVEKAIELLNQPSGERELGVDPDSGNMLIAKSGRYGPYVTEVLPEPVVVEGEKPKRKKAAAKPRTASLLSTMSLDTITLDDALRLMSLPRVVGVHPETGVEITAQNGRYGPYLLMDKDSRTLPSEEAMFTVTVQEALVLYAQPKERRGRQAAAPAKVVGTDSTTGKEILLKEGRFGPYVTDGEFNASLRRSDDPETISVERAGDLLAEKRAAGPAPAKKTAARRPAKKTTTRKSAKA